MAHGTIACKKTTCGSGTVMVGGACVVDQTDFPAAGAPAAGTEVQMAAANDPAAKMAAVNTDVQADAGASSLPTQPASAPAAPSAQGGSDPSSAGNSTPASMGSPEPQPSADAGTPSAGSSVNPDNPTCLPTTEQCDGLDNDCDASVDEEIEPMSCGKELGICRPGTIQCRNGQWDDPVTECVGAVGPMEEVCDAERLDEDCNGMPNDGCGCTDGEVMPCGAGPFTCTKGAMTCKGGQWSACEGEVRGTAEKCDGEDNDCNGAADNGGNSLCTGTARFCDGKNGCVACKRDSDCRPTSAACSATFCDTSSHTCEMRAADDGTACTTNGGQRGRCGSGSCLQCIANQDCASGEVCQQDRCVKSCGNRKLDEGEACDLGAQSEGNDGVGFRIAYDRYTCDSNCKRLYYYETCANGCGTGPSCVGNVCVGSCSAASNGGSCSLPLGGGNGFCFNLGCFPYCSGDPDCPGDTSCRGMANDMRKICL